MSKLSVDSIIVHGDKCSGDVSMKSVDKEQPITQRWHYQRSCALIMSGMHCLVT